MNIDPRRVAVHRSDQTRRGLVAYRMSRDQRVRDNWALLFARAKALELGQRLVVIFTLTPGYPRANGRHFEFMIRGLRQVERDLDKKGIPFICTVDDDPGAGLRRLVREFGIATIVSDFDPLRHKRRWIDEIHSIEGVDHFEVDSHNIVPCWQASGKAEFGAYTIRPKIHRALADFLVEFPELQEQAPQSLEQSARSKYCLEAALEALVFSNSASILPEKGSGEAAAFATLNHFISAKLGVYDRERNLPDHDGQSRLSPYLHFGQIAPQRVALEVMKVLHRKSELFTAAEDSGENADSLSANGKAFLEELIVRRELSDNFCFYNKAYDSVQGFPVWAKKDIELHRNDYREYLYSSDQFEAASTHDPLWNAAQRELVRTGTMHGYMRMYWAKKILEWTPLVEAAMEIAIYLNDKYSLDGRDPNGYAGIAWSLGGVHDRAWFPRHIFGKIRYMSYSGCKSKFKVDAYIQNQEPRLIT
jgi:deoxyribodipyrimidine photo-lyase